MKRNIPRPYEGIENKLYASELEEETKEYGEFEPALLTQKKWHRVMKNCPRVECHGWEEVFIRFRGKRGTVLLR